MIKRTIRLLFLPTILSFVLACAEVPLTHRKTLHLLPQSQMLALSLQQYDKALKESRLSTNQKKLGVVRKVGKRIARAAEAFLKDLGEEDKIKSYEWEFNLIEDDKVINAWCMPGGKVAVYTGILPVALDENGLAVVLGHEVAHAIARHGNERMSQGLLASMGGIALSTALAEQPDTTSQLFMAAFGIGVNVGFLLPYSRLHESEADRIGLILTAMAGYDPAEAVPFWARMAEKGGAEPPEFLSTHPAPASRIENIKVYIAEALPYYQRSLK